MDAEKLGKSRFLNLLLKPAGGAMESRLRRWLLPPGKTLRGAGLKPATLGHPERRMTLRPLSDRYASSGMGMPRERMSSRTCCRSAANDGFSTPMPPGFRPKSGMTFMALAAPTRAKSS